MWAMSGTFFEQKGDLKSCLIDLSDYDVVLVIDYNVTDSFILH